MRPEFHYGSSVNLCNFFSQDLDSAENLLRLVGDGMKIFENEFHIVVLRMAERMSHRLADVIFIHVGYGEVG